MVDPEKANWLEIFTVTGQPLTKKNGKIISFNSRTGGRFLRTKPEAKAWETLLIMEMQRQRRHKWTFKDKVWVKALFFRETMREVDLSNLEESVADALQAAGIILNDHLIHSWDGSRKFLGQKEPKVIIHVQPYRD